MTPLSRFQQNITTAMESQGIKAKTLSKKADLGETAVRDILKMDREPTLTTIVKLAHGLNTTASELMKGVQEEYQPPLPSIAETLKFAIEKAHPNASTSIVGDKIVIADEACTRHVITIEKE